MRTQFLYRSLSRSPWRGRSSWGISPRAIESGKYWQYWQILGQAGGKSSWNQQDENQGRMSGFVNPGKLPPTLLALGCAITWKAEFCWNPLSCWGLCALL